MSNQHTNPRIKAKALGLHWRDGRLLAFEVYDEQGAVKGVRPLGGSIEVGERAEVAVRREFMEEIGVEVAVRSGPIVVESIFVHKGAPGHEILFIYEVEFPKAAFAGQDHILYHEDNGDACIARWYDLNALDLEDGPALYPTGLKQMLLNPARN